MKSFIFWQRWLFYSSLLFSVFGLVFAIYGNNPFFMPYNKALAHVFMFSESIPANNDLFRAFIWGPLGATIACCYILLAFIAWFPFQRKERWARNAIIVAFGIWVLVDSAVCVYYGVCFQVYIINTFSIVQKGLPIIFTWKEFKWNPGI